MVPELASVSDDLSRGRPPPKVTTRTFLGWFQAQRRGIYVVERIRSELREAKVVTDPDFESAWIDGNLEFVPEKITVASTDEITDGKEAVLLDLNTTLPVDTSPVAWIKKDATYRISKLLTANLGVVSVKPDDELSRAIALMLSGDYSQLPVMQNSQNVKGIITWKSIGSRLGLSRTPTTARQAMDHHVEVRADSSLFDAIPVIVAKDYVLVRSAANEISGIITASDLSVQFRDMTEPFLLLSEIENQIRNLIGDKFSNAELIDVQQSKSGPEIETVADLTLGDYVSLLQSRDRWTRIKVEIHRETFCGKLDEVRQIRNRVMHFDIDGISPEDLEKLRAFTNLLKQIELITSSQ